MSHKLKFDNESNTSDKHPVFPRLPRYVNFHFAIKSLDNAHYGAAPVDPRRPQNRGSHDYLRAHKGSRRMSRPLIQDSSVSVLFPPYKGNLT